MLTKDLRIPSFSSSQGRIATPKALYRSGVNGVAIAERVPESGEDIDGDGGFNSSGSSIHVVKMYTLA